MPSCDDYDVGDPASCNGKDTQTVMTDFQILYIWLILSVVFFIGLLLSMIRDVVPVHYGSDVEPRYHSGESIRGVKYIFEECLLTGWCFKKPNARFTYIGRWCLFFSTFFVEMLMLGVFYYVNKTSSDLSDYGSVDYGYAFLAALAGFIHYLVCYVLLVKMKGEVQSNAWPRTAIGYIYIFVSYSLSTSFIFWLTYEFYDNDDDDDGVVDFWMVGFAVTSLIELTISEYIRMGSRALMIWAQKDAVPATDTSIELQGYNAPRMKTGKTFSFSQTT